MSIMTSELTKEQAALPARFPVASFRDERGNVARHFLHPAFLPDQAAFERWMDDPHFAEVIGREAEAEKIANAPLDKLASLAVTSRARTLFLEWLAFVNVDLEPWGTGGAIHYRPHWARVCLLALALGEAEGLDEADLDALCAAAMFHDSRRRDPYLDTGHGQRAADYYTQFCSECASGASRHSEAGRRIVFDERVYQAIAWHDRDDADGKAALAAAGHDVPSGTAASGLHMLELFKDADALDRVRLGSDGLDTSYLRTPHALELVEYAHGLNEFSAGTAGR